MHQLVLVVLSLLIQHLEVFAHRLHLLLQEVIALHPPTSFRGISSRIEAPFASILRKRLLKHCFNMAFISRVCSEPPFSLLLCLLDPVDHFFYHRYLAWRESFRAFYSQIKLPTVFGTCPCETPSSFLMGHEILVRLISCCGVSCVDVAIEIRLLVGVS